MSWRPTLARPVVRLPVRNHGERGTPVLQRLGRYDCAAKIVEPYRLTEPFRPIVIEEPGPVGVPSPDEPVYAPVDVSAPIQIVPPVKPLIRRFFAPPAPMIGRARLGQLPDESQMYAAVKTAIVQTGNADMYAAFVKFALTHVPPDVAASWTVDAYAIGETLKTFERSYAAKQDETEAAAWGLKALGVLSDLRADMAFSRLDMAGNENLLGCFEWISIDGSAPVTEEGFFFVEFADPGIPGAGALIKNLCNSATQPTASLFFLYAYVYRALQWFVPYMAKWYIEGGLDPVYLYSDDFAAPVSDPARFLKWVISANVVMFKRAGVTEALPLMLTAADLEAIMAGETLAEQQLMVEAKLLAVNGIQIQATIDSLTWLETLIQSADPTEFIPSLASAIPWYAWLIGGLAAAGVTVIAVKSALR